MNDQEVEKKQLLQDAEHRLSNLSISELEVLLASAKTKTNFASPIQFGGMILAKASNIWETSLTIDAHKVVVQLSELQLEKSQIRVLRIFFAGSVSSEVLAQNLLGYLQQHTLQYIVLNFLTESEIQKHERMLTDFCPLRVLPYPELVCDLKILTSATTDSPHNTQSAQLAKKYCKALRIQPEVRYVPFEEFRNQEGAHDKIEQFFTDWSNQTNTSGVLPRKVINKYWDDPKLLGGVCVDPLVTGAVVALNAFAPHPADQSVIISTINQSLRYRRELPYSQLGTFSYLRQARHIEQLFPYASEILLGGIGTTANQQSFKRQFAKPGESWSCAVVLDPYQLSAHYTYEQFARLAHVVWE